MVATVIWWQPNPLRLHYTPCGPKASPQMFPLRILGTSMPPGSTGMWAEELKELQEPSAFRVPAQEECKAFKKTLKFKKLGCLVVCWQCSLVW